VQFSELKVPPPDNVKLGPRISTIVDGAVWREKHSFPAHQAWADEIEKVLAFLESQDQFTRFKSRLCAWERDGAMAEARAGFYFHRNGFRIVQWEPVAVAGIPGDIEIAWRDTQPIFVEVKCPSWEGELDEEEIQAGRTECPKYINAEGHWIDPVERVLYAIRKSLPKFSSDRVNLVVVVDDLFVSPLDIPTSFVTGRLAGELEDLRYNKVSGVFMLNPVVYPDKEVEYRAFFVPGNGKPIADPVKSAFLNENARFEKTR
jgi:hypothetical protein